MAVECLLGLHVTTLKTAQTMAADSSTNMVRRSMRIPPSLGFRHTACACYMARAAHGVCLLYGVFASSLPERPVSR